MLMTPPPPPPTPPRPAADLWGSLRGALSSRMWEWDPSAWQDLAEEAWFRAPGARDYLMDHARQGALPDESRVVRLSSGVLSREALRRFMFPSMIRPVEQADLRAREVPLDHERDPEDPLYLDQPLLDEALQGGFLRFSGWDPSDLEHSWVVEWGRVVDLSELPPYEDLMFAWWHLGGVADSWGRPRDFSLSHAIWGRGYISCVLPSRSTAQGLAAEWHLTSRAADRVEHLSVRLAARDLAPSSLRAALQGGQVVFPALRSLREVRVEVNPAEIDAPSLQAILREAFAAPEGKPALFWEEFRDGPPPGVRYPVILSEPPSALWLREWQAGSLSREINRDYKRWMPHAPGQALPRKGDGKLIPCEEFAERLALPLLEADAFYPEAADPYRAQLFPLSWRDPEARALVRDPAPKNMVDARLEAWGRWRHESAQAAMQRFESTRRKEKSVRALMGRR